MHKIILTLITCFIFNFLYAQKIETGEVFSDKETTAKTLLLNNGNTILLTYSSKNGMEVIVYNSSRNKIGSKPVKDGLWEPDNDQSYESFYEINGKPTLFVIQNNGKKPTLIRV